MYIQPSHWNPDYPCPTCRRIRPENICVFSKLHQLSGSYSNRVTPNMHNVCAGGCITSKITNINNHIFYSWTSQLGRERKYVFSFSITTNFPYWVKEKGNLKVKAHVSCCWWNNTGEKYCSITGTEVECRTISFVSSVWSLFMWDCNKYLKLAEFRKVRRPNNDI